MAVDTQMIQDNVVVRRTQVAETLAAIQAWPHWEEVFLNCVKESTMTYEAFAQAIQAGASSREAFSQALRESQMTREQFHHYLPEYQKFMALCANYPHIGMMSTGVDAIWHGHLLVSDRYQQFCSDVLGKFVHHLPCSLYPVYGVDPTAARTSCLSNCVPSTCKGNGGGCSNQDGHRDGDPEMTKQNILAAGVSFVSAYTEAFGEGPSVDVWEQLL